MRRGQPFLRERGGQWQVCTGRGPLVVSRHTNEDDARAAMIELVQRRVRAAMATVRRRRAGKGPAVAAARPAMWRGPA